MWFNVSNCYSWEAKYTQTYFVTLSMACMWTLECVCARIASCCAHLRQRPPTRLEFVAETSDFWCFNLASKSSHVFWDSERCFLKRRNKEKKFEQHPNISTSYAKYNNKRKKKIFFAVINSIMYIILHISVACVKS